MKKESQQKINKALETLKSNGIPFRTGNEGVHIIIEIKEGGRFDYWPTTGKIWFQGKENPFCTNLRELVEHCLQMMNMWGMKPVTKAAYDELAKELDDRKVVMDKLALELSEVSQQKAGLESKLVARNRSYDDLFRQNDDLKKENIRLMRKNYKLRTKRNDPCIEDIAELKKLVDKICGDLLPF